MRAKIIGVFAVVVTIVTALSLLLMSGSVEKLSDKGVAQRAVTAAVAQLQVEGLSLERWLAQQAASEKAREPFEAGSAGARSEQATTFANGVEQRAKTAPPFASIKPMVIVLFDKTGRVLGRNKSALMRGDNLGARHPDMMTSVLAGATGSALWVDAARNEQQLVSFAAVRAADGTILGGIAMGTAFNNERLATISTTTSHVPLIASVKRGEGMVVLATSSQLDDASNTAVSASGQALGSEQVVTLAGIPRNIIAAARPLRGYAGDGAVIIAVSSVAAGGLAQLWLPFLGVLALGLVLTVVAAHLLDRYVSQPISDLEEGLLAVINGERDVRFELEHDLFGGLVFRINSLLNELLGVEEDTTDADGRLSTAPPSSSRFTAALNVDERMVSLSLNDVAEASELRDEAPSDYYRRIFNEYVAAKKHLGDPTDHLRFSDFSRRIKNSERELSDRHGKPFRYRIEPNGGEVVFVAVPLA
ncbi:MAG TPA: hypothetical protein ENK23_08675 [Sorangium sp.]|nr:hypothetical protein [Sorangium sp.]